MTNNDYSAMMKDMWKALPVDMSAMEDAFKTSAALSEKLSGVALEAAGKSAELSTQWAQDTLAKMNDVSKAKEEPADYAKAMTDFATASAEVAAENMAAFTEIAKKVQMETVELMVTAGKDMGQEASAAVQKAASEMAGAAQKAAPAKKPARAK
ncbi:phasin family protein [Antarcticimicrobium luteum]|uniref:Phasin, PhaP n=1 Tax=Antarcticimicrobium luteum TaxID=2547397 RepID=A0A4V6PM27_9RHOB|nr:phasin family protein [Antarcticimicrobium luteum]TDK43147.1 phasin, PhaP [Antarcticimicrobium luteum]